jgi:hypothetical protein
MRHPNSYAHKVAGGFPRRLRTKALKRGRGGKYGSANLRYDGGVRVILTMLWLLGASAHAAGALNIYFIDVEGG